MPSRFISIVKIKKFTLMIRARDNVTFHVYFSYTFDITELFLLEVECSPRMLCDYSVVFSENFIWKLELIFVSGSLNYRDPRRAL